MTKNSYSEDFKRQELHKRLAHIEEKHKAVYKQIASTRNDVDRSHLERQALNLKKEIQDIYQKLHELSTQQEASSSIPLPIHLPEKIIQSFNQQELEDLCFRLSIDINDLPAIGRQRKIQELVLFIQRRQRMPELLHLLHQLRPKISWPDETIEQSSIHIEETVADHLMPPTQTASAIETFPFTTDTAVRVFVSLSQIFLPLELLKNQSFSISAPNPGVSPCL